MSLSEEILRLQSLRESGVLTYAEFEAAKAKLLSGGPPPVPEAQPPPPYPAQPAYTAQPAYAAQSPYAAPAYAAQTAQPAPAAPSEAQQRQWAMFLHLSTLAGFVVPLAALVAPIIIWQIKKQEMPSLDAHGCHAANWIISSVIYGIISAILCLALIGIPMLIALGLVSIIFPVIAAIKANDGIVWRYPLSFTFFTPANQQ